MSGLKLREEFMSRRLKRTVIELANSNKTGGLLLLPKKFNASYGDLTHAEKRPHYNGQNILARTFSDEAYQRNPGLIQKSFEEN